MTRLRAATIQWYMYSIEIDEMFRTPPFSALALSLLWSDGALNYCIFYFFTTVSPPRPLVSLSLSPGGTAADKSHTQQRYSSSTLITTLTRANTHESEHNHSVDRKS